MGVLRDDPYRWYPDAGYFSCKVSRSPGECLLILSSPLFSSGLWSGLAPPLCHTAEPAQITLLHPGRCFANVHPQSPDVLDCVHTPLLHEVGHIAWGLPCPISELNPPSLIMWVMLLVVRLQVFSPFDEITGALYVAGLRKCSMEPQRATSLKHW